jgi:hypothetical protein
MIALRVLQRSVGVLSMTELSMAEMSIRELRVRAERYRTMAQTATSGTMVNSLLRLVKRLEHLAKRQEENGETVA